MSRIPIALLAGTALLAAAPTFAQPGGGGGAGRGNAGGPPTTMGGSGANGPSSTGMERASPNSPISTTTTRSPDTSTTGTTTGTTRRDQARQNSQGPQNASPTGVANANENSVLASGSVAADTLPGLTTGLTVQSSTGTSLGTISQVVTGSDGSIRMIVITNAAGETMRIPANSLSISGDVVTVAGH